MPSDPIKGALVAIEYESGETYVWRLTDDVWIDESFELILVGRGAGNDAHFDLRIKGYGQRTDREKLTP